MSEIKETVNEPASVEKVACPENIVNDGELSAADLDKVSGGVSNLQQQQHELLKAITQNLRG